MPADSLDLELPDWSGMDDASARVRPVAAVRLCEHNPSLIRNIRPQRPEDRAEKYSVEFVL